ncbi:hypothetical protein AAC387_Pa04g1595 [Persea americana]
MTWALSLDPPIQGQHKRSQLSMPCREPILLGQQSKMEVVSAKRRPRDSEVSRYSESDGGANPVAGLAIARLMFAIASWAQKFNFDPDSMQSLRQIENLSGS